MQTRKICAAKNGRNYVLDHRTMIVFRCKEDKTWCVQDCRPQGAGWPSFKTVREAFAEIRRRGHKPVRDANLDG